MTRHEADTRDTLQEVFLKLARRPALLADARDERAFLLRLAHNAARDLFRRRETRAADETRFANEAPRMLKATAEEIDWRNGDWPWPGPPKAPLAE